MIQPEDYQNTKDDWTRLVETIDRNIRDNLAQGATQADCREWVSSLLTKPWPPYWAGQLRYTYSRSRMEWLAQSSQM